MKRSLATVGVALSLALGLGLLVFSIYFHMIWLIILSAVFSAMQLIGAVILIIDYFQTRDSGEATRKVVKTK